MSTAVSDAVTGTIVTFTPNPAIDASTAVDRVIAERKLQCRPPRFDPGGGGTNVARVIHRLGGDATALFLSGGPTGELLRQLLEHRGVANRTVHCEQWTRENLTVLEESSGRQFRFGMPGPEVTMGEWHSAIEVLKKWEPTPQFVVASGSLPPGAPADGFAQVARTVKERGSRFVLDTSGSALISGISSGVYLIKPNLRELAELAGAPIADEEHITTAARSVIDRGLSEGVVVSLGAGGAYLLTAKECERIVAPIVPVRAESEPVTAWSVASYSLSYADGHSPRLCASALRRAQQPLCDPAPSCATAGTWSACSVRRELHCDGRKGVGAGRSRVATGLAHRGGTGARAEVPCIDRRTASPDDRWHLSRQTLCQGFLTPGPKGTGDVHPTPIRRSPDGS